MPGVSVVIPVNNEKGRIEKCLAGILKQKEIGGRLEIIVVDSGSTDGTWEILGQYPVKRLQIEPEKFSHGASRNLGIQHATGDFTVLTVGDAVPVDAYWIARMVTHFKDPEVAGVCGQQIVPESLATNPLEWFRPSNAPEVITIQYPDQESFDQLSPEQKVEACQWDNVTACYRTVLKQQTPFQEVFFGEDFLWAKEMLRAGYTLVRDSNARVYHYHMIDSAYQKKRTTMAAFLLYDTCGYILPEPDLVHGILKTPFQFMRMPEVGWRDKAYWTVYNIRNKWVYWRSVRRFAQAMNHEQSAKQLRRQYLKSEPQRP